MHIYPWQTNTPPLIKCRSLENHYTKSVSYIAQCTYTHGRLTPPPPPSEHRSLENHYTKEASYIAQCTSTHGRTTPTPLNWEWMS